MTRLMSRIGLISLLGLSMTIPTLGSLRQESMYKDQVAVLLYHHISDTVQGSGTVSTALFRKQLTYLTERNYHFITMDEFKNYLNGAPVPDNAALVTFDDGYESFYTDAVPILKEYNIPGTVFVITGTISEPRKGTTPFMDLGELRALAADQPLITVGSHTDSLHEKQEGRAFLTQRLSKSGRQESDEEYLSRIKSDTIMARSKLKEAGAGDVDIMAYPFGFYNRQAVASLQEQGIKYAFTVMPRVVTRSSDKMRLPRINAGGPYVTPEALHNMIKRRVKREHKGSQAVRLRETVEQLGGELYVDQSDNKMVIFYNGEKYKINAQSTAFTKLSDNTIYTLQKPLFNKNNYAYIQLTDLQSILQTTILYDEATGTFTCPAPAESDPAIAKSTASLSRQ